MNDTPAQDTQDEQADALVLEYTLDAPPSQVWRAVSIPALREQWLPDAVVSDPDPVSVTHEEEIRYRMRDDAPPFLESLVTFQIEPDGEGGTRLRIIHELADARLERRQRPAANDGTTWLMMAA
ncbi:SRPBCC domain-containing protein [Achromobacter sp. AONIH1]|uniref:SRPBCC family protein n=1 Tax=unclassified Achromobacter TaxID=2626865 RepID=UPI000CD1E3E2|nr:SRPBCC domain-containing protein [Achromobacter sp. AONIH1]AUT45373.1 hypothetical protein C2U31_04890 [Achromobacter sp. AONIH1]